MQGSLKCINGVYVGVEGLLSLQHANPIMTRVATVSERPKAITSMPNAAWNPKRMSLKFLVFTAKQTIWATRILKTPLRLYWKH